MFTKAVFQCVLLIIFLILMKIWSELFQFWLYSVTMITLSVQPAHLYSSTSGKKARQGEKFPCNGGSHVPSNITRRNTMKPTTVPKTVLTNIVWDRHTCWKPCFRLSLHIPRSAMQQKGWVQTGLDTMLHIKAKEVSGRHTFQNGLCSHFFKEVRYAKA